MCYKKLLLSIQEDVLNNTYETEGIKESTLENIKIISEGCFSQKGVFTVIVTLSIYKIIHPEQDIRNHQTQIEGGFSGRTIDTQFITPTLKELKYPSMAESGWLTRSLEQPHPYLPDYPGKINGKGIKKAFLELVSVIQENKQSIRYILIELLKRIKVIQEENKVAIMPILNPDRVTIFRLIEALEQQFSFKYNTFGGSKLPVIAFYALYSVLLQEVSRYKECNLKPLGSHTASDLTSKSSGDIEVFNGGELFESVEIKLDKNIDSNIVRIAREKIIKYSPKRYYILSTQGVKEEDVNIINEIISEVKKEHGCQIIVNGLIPTLKYYFRLISDLEKFFPVYSLLIEEDLELKAIHKQKWNELVQELSNGL
jgi:DNA (cytosine-5)-methyltransferase 1